MKKLIIVFFLGIFSPFQTASAQEKPFSFDYEKITLSNGLNVVLQQDKSDPVVAVSVLYHVGSSREKPGKTGLAHFFEHMMFNRSENVSEEYFHDKIIEWGGSANGQTIKDHTIYFNHIPKNVLEKLLWLESDRMGFLTNSVTRERLEAEKPIVLNEKLQRVDNVAYGYGSEVINKALYPSNHPYHWPVIGEVDDLQNATLDDVKEFYEQYYGPNNATLVIAGDFDKEETQKMVRKYFGGIPSRGTGETSKPIPVQLDSTISLYHEDAFASVPELTMTWPAVYHFHKDQWALDALGRFLSGSKNAPLYEIVVEEKNQAANTSAYHRSQELAGTFTIKIRANGGTDLDSVKASVMEAFDSIEEKGIHQDDLDRIKTKQETMFYNNLSSVMFKSFRLAFYSEYAGSPDFMTTDLKNIRDVTPEQVMEVYMKYIKDKNYVLTSFVPEKERNLAVTGSQKADVKQQAFTIDDHTKTLSNSADDFVRTPSSFDRTVEPPFGENPLLDFPEIWISKLSNGMGVYGIEDRELPLVNLSIRIPGGHMAEEPDRAGTAHLLTKLMMESTKDKTSKELEDAIHKLGVNIVMTASRGWITLSARGLSENYEETVSLIQEILMEPQWDKKAFERIKKAVINDVRQRKGDAGALASASINRVLYGEDHILGTPVTGSIASIETITLQDLQTYYNDYLSPSIANFHIAGNISKKRALNSLKKIEEQWTAQKVTLPEINPPKTPEEPQLYFVDAPNAQQSQIRIGKLTVAGNHKDYYPLTVAQHRLGGGVGSILFQILREEKGYTYGAFSEIKRSPVKSPLIAYFPVKSDVTDKALLTFKKLIADYGVNYTEGDLQKTKKSLIRANALQFETLPNLLNVLETMSTFDLPPDYIERQQQTLQEMRLDEVKRLIKEYLDPSKMIYVVAGDKAAQFNRLREIEGLGELKEINKAKLNSIK